MMRDIRTRSDVALLLLDWIRPLKGHYSEGGAQLIIGHTSAHYGETSIRMEGFSRVLWGLAPLFSQRNELLPEEAREEIEDWKILVRDGLIHGTAPGHEEYWLDVWDYDQKMVEMAAIVNAILLAPNVFWEPLDAGQHSTNFGNTAAKYQKFVYSNLFGFSVPRGIELEDGAFDNTLAATRAGENFWRMRQGVESYEVTEEYTKACYELLPGGMVESLIIPQEKGHIRIHHIRTKEDIELADGGFAIRVEDGIKRMETSMVQTTERAVRCHFPWGNAGAENLEGDGDQLCKINKK